MSDDRWRCLVADADYLAQHWGRQAAAAGWSALELFGRSAGFARRLDRDGLAILLEGRKLSELDAAEATILGVTGATTKFRRGKRLLGSIPLWEKI
jgi:hypothetical protein